MKALVLKPPMGGAARNVVRDFVYGCWCNGRRVGGMQMPPLNDLYVVGHARAGGLDVNFLDAQLEPERFATLLRNRFEDYGAVIMMGSTQSFAADAKLFARIKSVRPEVYSILFGSHATFMPQAALAADSVDFIVLREPEETVRDLLHTLAARKNIGNVRGIGFRGANGQAVINQPRPFMDMDDLPIPDRTLLPKGIDYFNPVVKRMPYTTLQTSRGCPGKCIFCTAPTFYGKRIRNRSAGNVLEELRTLAKLGYREVFFRDETFTAYKKRNVEICEGMLAEGLDLTWVANGRVDMIDRETMALMKRAGCHMLKFGVESGDDGMLSTYQKGTRVEQAKEAFRMAREVGLDTHAHLVFGGPGESPATMQKTIDLVIEMGATTASFGILTPYPGTTLFNMVAEKRGDIGDGSGSTMENLHVEGFYSNELCGMDSKELMTWIKRAYRRFYMRPEYLARRLAGIRSTSELMVLATAGTNIFQFALTGNK